jgi:hypothetical protein
MAQVGLLMRSKESVHEFEKRDQEKGRQRQPQHLSEDEVLQFSGAPRRSAGSSKAGRGSRRRRMPAEAACFPACRRQWRGKSRRPTTGHCGYFACRSSRSMPRNSAGMRMSTLRCGMLKKKMVARQHAGHPARYRGDKRQEKAQIKIRAQARRRKRHRMKKLKCAGPGSQREQKEERAKGCDCMFAASGAP